MRILLIEDDPSTAESIELMLRKADLNTYVTDSGEEGIELAKLYDYDLIILDLSLPDIDGYEVLRQAARRAGRYANADPVRLRCCRQQDQGFRMRRG